MIRLILLLLFITASCALSAQEIAITFDDAPTPDGPLFSGEERTNRIISHLERYNVTEAAFFVLTSNISTKSQRERLAKYVAAGHLLANHSHTHPWIHVAGTPAYSRDIQRADSILRLFPGYTAWFRYPYLDEGRSVPVRDSVRAVLNQLGLSNGYVTVDNYDWYLNALLDKARKDRRKINRARLSKVYVDHIFSSIMFYDRIARKKLGRSPKHVLLLHENDMAALFLGDLLSHLHKHGWRVVSPREAYQDPIATRIPDVTFNGQGRVAAIAREMGVPARELVQASEDEAFLDSLVLERKVFR